MDLYTWMIAATQNDLLARDPALRAEPLICHLCAAVFGKCPHSLEVTEKKSFYPGTTAVCYVCGAVYAKDKGHNCPGPRRS